MGKRLLGKRLRRQAGKGKVRPRTIQRAMNTMRMDPRPQPAKPVQTINQGGKVESYQDQVMKKFGGGRIKAKKSGGKIKAKKK